MSNALAIATTTIVLADIVQSGLGAVSGAKVTTLRPDDKEDGTPAPEANVFLYQIAPNPALRNADLPTRSGPGELRRRPELALDLSYLVTFYGEDATLEPQRLLGGAVAALHARPRVTAEAVQAIVDASAGAPVSDPRHHLGQTDLAEQVEHIGFTPITLTLEELSKLWSTLFRVPYALSVAYRASVVLVEAQLTPRPAPPVEASNLYVLPIRRPRVERIENADGADEPVVLGSTIVLRGQRLRGDATRVRVGDAFAEPPAPTDTEITIDLAEPPFAAGALRAGAQGAQVVHDLEIGTPPAPHRGFESNVVAFVLRPTLTGASLAGDAVTLTVAPPPKADQRITLLLDGDESYSFKAAPRDDDADPVSVPITGVAAGGYRARVQVDGAESPPDPAPTLTVP